MNKKVKFNIHDKVRVRSHLSAKYLAIGVVVGKPHNAIEVEFSDGRKYVFYRSELEKV